MNVYYNNNLKFLYFVSTRNGSSVIHEISTVYPELEHIEITRAFSILAENPHTPIYIPFRDPEVRFKSGLAITLYRTIPEESELTYTDPITLLNTGYDKIFKSNLEYLDTIFGNSVPLVSGVSKGYKRRPFHLFDDHLDHSLYVPLILILHKYNVKLIYLEQWSDHLKPLYPEANSFIAQRERYKSSTTNTPEVYPIWSVYKSVFIDKQLEDAYPIYRTYSAKTLRWNDWMAPEKEIFKVLKQYKDSPSIRAVCLKLFQKLIDGKIYFTDPFSNSNNMALSIINHIEQQQPLVTEFIHMSRAHGQIKKSVNELSLREYISANTPIMLNLQNPKEK